jgi:uncharacterized protein (DUF1015 family)
VLPLEATDHLGTLSRLWPVSDPRVIQRVQGLLFQKPVFIADGHHRYETALRYRDELTAAGEVVSTNAPTNFVLMMLVGLSDPGLLILPTHRLLSGLLPLKSSELHSLLQPHFEVTKIGAGPDAAREAWALIDGNTKQSLLGFGTVSDDTWHVAELRSTQKMDELAAEHSPAWRGLGVSILHVLVLNLVRAKFGVEPACKYVHLLDEALTATNAGECQLAALVPPATMQHVADIAGNLEKMPPKSTYFYPKLLSGLVFNAVR